MNPNFTDDIKKLLVKKPLDKEDIQPLKTALKKYAKDYLNLKKGGNSSINLTDTFNNDIIVADANSSFIRDIGRQMERSRDYTMYENKKDDGSFEIVVVPLDRPWWEKYSPILSIISLVLGAILTVTGGIIKSRLEKQAPSPVYNIQDSRIQPLSDSLKTIDRKLKALEDSLVKYKNH